MIIFKMPFENYPEAPTPTGSREITEYIEHINSEGKTELIENGKTNIYEKIQKAHEPTKIKNILKRYINGDENALNQIQGIYTDITNAPTNWIDAQNTIIKAEKEFEKLPTDLKAQFNHNPNEFLASIARGEGIEKIKKYYTNIQIVPENPEEIIKEGEEK